MQMIKFIETPRGYDFLCNNACIAVGEYTQKGFHLLQNDNIHVFDNAQHAFTHLRSIYDPSTPSAKTMEMFLTPSRPIDNMSKLRSNHADLCN